MAGHDLQRYDIGRAQTASRPLLELNGDFAEQSAPSPLASARRHRLLVVSLVLLATFGVAAASVAIPSRYDGVASVMMRSRPGKFGNMQAVENREIDPNLIGTEVQILRSEELARRVTNKLHLQDTAEFGGPPQGLSALVGRLTGMLADTSTIGDAADTATSVTVKRLMNAVTISNDGHSYVIQITARTLSPALSAAIANEYVQTYLDFSREHKSNEIQRTDIMLQQHLVDLKRKADESERAVEDYRQRHGLTTQFATHTSQNTAATGNTTVAGQQMAELSNQLVQTDGVLAEKQADLQQILALKQAGDADTAPAVLASPLIQRMREYESDLAAKEGALASRVGPDSAFLNPIRAQLTEVRRGIAKEITKIISGVASQANAARAREESLKAQLAGLRAEVDAQGSASVQLKALETTAAAAYAVYASFLSQAHDAMNVVDMQTPDADLISAAAVPRGSSYPPRLLLVVLAFAGSIPLAIVIAMRRDGGEAGFRSAEEFEEGAGVPLLGMLPLAKRRRRRNAFRLEAQLPLYREMVNVVRSWLGSIGQARSSRILLVTSATPGEGKTTFAVSLAASYASAGERTLLIDGDLRRPSVGPMLGVRGNGLNMLYDHQASLASGAALLSPAGPFGVVIETVDGLHVVPASIGLRNTQDLLADGRLEALLELARSQYDFIIVDAPPVLGMADALVLSRITDETILVVRWHHTPRALVMTALRNLRAAGATVAGAVMMQVNTKRYAIDRLGRDAYLYGRYSKYYGQSL